MTTSGPEVLANDLYSKLMPHKTGPFKVDEVSPPTITVEEDGIQNTVSIHLATVVPSTILEQRQLEYTLYRPVDNQDYIIDEEARQTSSEEIANTFFEYSVDGIVFHVREGDIGRYVGCWYGYTPAKDTVEPP